MILCLNEQPAKVAISQRRSAVCVHIPGVWICASTWTIYLNSGDIELAFLSLTFSTHKSQNIHSAL